MRSFSQTAIFTFPTGSVCRHVNLAAAKHWRVMPKLKDGSIVFRVQGFLSTVSNIMNIV